MDRRRLSTATLNMVLGEAVAWRPPPSCRGDPRKGRVYYATQVCQPAHGHRPPAGFAALLCGS